MSRFSVFFPGEGDMLVCYALTEAEAFDDGSVRPLSTSSAADSRPFDAASQLEVARPGTKRV